MASLALLAACGQRGELLGTARGGAGGAGAPSDAITPQRLRSELRDSPLGVQTATPRLSWELAAGGSARGLSQTGYEVLVATSPDLLAVGKGDLLATGVVASAEQRLVYAGKSLGSLAHAYWKVRVRDQSGAMSAWSAVAEFTVGLLAVGLVGAVDHQRRRVERCRFSGRTSPSTGRSGGRCSPSAGSGSTRCASTARNASKAVMEPAWTNYAKSCDYVMYDVTSSVVQGRTLWGAAGKRDVQRTAHHPIHEVQRFVRRAQGDLRLALDYVDGTSTTVARDTSWKTAPGPSPSRTSTAVRTSMPERSPRLGQGRVRRVGLGKRDRRRGGCAGAGGRRRAPGEGDADVCADERDPAECRDLRLRSRPELLGLAAAGRPGAGGRLRDDADGRASHQRRSREPEELGLTCIFHVHLEGRRSRELAPALCVYGVSIRAGRRGGPGAQAASFPGRPQITGVSGQFIYSSAETVGQFSSSDPDLMRIHALVLAAFHSNLQSVLTDCPQLEKLGWLESRHLLAAGIMFNHDVASFYEKVIDDTRDAQTSSGLVPDIAPEYTTLAGLIAILRSGAAPTSSTRGRCTRCTATSSRWSPTTPT